MAERQQEPTMIEIPDWVVMDYLAGRLTFDQAMHELNKLDVPCWRRFFTLKPLRLAWQHLCHPPTPMKGE